MALYIARDNVLVGPMDPKVRNDIFQENETQKVEIEALKGKVKALEESRSPFASPGTPATPSRPLAPAIPPLGVEGFHRRSRWFDCTEPSLTTSLQGNHDVQGAYARGLGGSSAQR